MLIIKDILHSFWLSSLQAFAVFDSAGPQGVQDIDEVVPFFLFFVYWGFFPDLAHQLWKRRQRGPVAKHILHKNPFYSIWYTFSANG